MITTIGQIAIVLAALATGQVDGQMEIKAGPEPPPPASKPATIVDWWTPSIMVGGMFLAALVGAGAVWLAQRSAARYHRERLQRLLPGKLLAEFHPYATLEQQATEYRLTNAVYTAAVRLDFRGAFRVYEFLDMD